MKGRQIREGPYWPGFATGEKGKCSSDRYPALDQKVTGCLTLSSAKKNSISSADDKPVSVTSIGSAWSAEAKFDFWRTAHRALKGQYRFAALLAAGGTVLGAIIGSQLGQRVYSSTGLVRIASVLPQVMHETDQNRPMAMFDGFIAAQRDVMLSRDVIEGALQEEPWRRAQRTGLAPSDAQFAANLKVETRARSDHLKVIFYRQRPRHRCRRGALDHRGVSADVCL